MSTSNQASDRRVPQYLRGVKILELSEFQSLHMSPSSYQPTAEEKSNISKSIQDALPSCSQAGDFSHYQKVVEILEEVNDAVYACISKPKSFNLPKLCFVDHHGSSPLHHPIESFCNFDTPDILAVFDQKIARQKRLPAKRLRSGVVKADVFHDVPWHLVESVIAVEFWNYRDRGFTRCVTHLGELNQARPDKPGAYGMSLGPDEYDILWSDASGVYRSDTYRWADIDGCLALVDYVTSLYVAPKHLSTRDFSVRSYEDKRQDGLPSRPLWKFEGLGDQLFKTKFVGRAHSRMTCVYVPNGEERLPVVKESYRSPERQFKEEVIITNIHKDGIVPGVVRARLHELATVMTIETNDITVDQQNPTRLEKTRLIMDTTGNKLSECKSVLDFLKVIFDAVEVHRFLVMNRGVFHRDISMNNVLCYPIFGGQLPLSNGKEARPHFIEELLEHEKLPDERNRSASCLLLDFDSAMDLKVPDALEIRLCEITGTATYKARALAQERWCCAVIFPDFPELDSPALQAYIKIYGQEEYDRYKSSNGLKLDLDRLDDEVSQEPRHDVESFYWIIVTFLLLSRPEGAQHKQDTTHKTLSLTWFRFHKEQLPKDGDGRDPIMEPFSKTWQELLHPGLQSMAPFLRKISAQIRPEYHLLVPEISLEQIGANKREPQEEVIPTEYLHEAMRRILLEEIMRLSSVEPIHLDPKNDRKPYFDLDWR